MKTRSKTGLAILAGGLSFVGTANAIDLILNGSFEAITGGSPNAYNSITDGTLAGWDGVVSGISYGYNYFSGPVIPASENPGLVYSWNQDGDLSHTNNYTRPLTQTVFLTNGVSASNIDAGTGQYTFSAWLASYTANPEQPYLTVKFFDAGSNQVGGTAVLDRVHSLFFTSFAVDFPAPSVFNDTTQLHDWAKYVKTSAIPPLARTAVVSVGRNIAVGYSGRTDTYVDLLKLDVTVANTRPSIESATPLDSGLPNLIPGNISSVTVTLRDGFYAVNTNSVQFSFDGTPHAASVSKVGTLTTIQYTIPGLLASGSAHSYQVVYSDNGPGLPQTNLLSFQVLDYTTLPPMYALPPGSGIVPGLTFRSVAAPLTTTNILDSTIARAVAQLNHTLIDPSTGQPYEDSSTPGTNSDGSYNIDTVINFNGDNLPQEGDFGGDTEFPGLLPSMNWFSTEALLFMDLPAGYYRLGVNSDDGFEVNALPPAGVAGTPMVLGIFDGGRGTADTLFDVLVTTPGLYPFQVIYFQSQGNASEEFFSVTNLATGGKVLVNDRTNVSAIRSWRKVPPRIASIVKSSSNVVLSWAYGAPPYQVQTKAHLTDTTWSNVGSSTTNMTATVPLSPGTTFFRVYSQ